MPTPRLLHAFDQMKKSRLTDLEEVNETIPRMNNPNTTDFLGIDFKSSKEIGDITSAAVQRYKQEIEALNIEVVSLKKALHQAKNSSPTIPSSPTKQSFKRSITSLKIGILP